MGSVILGVVHRAQHGIVTVWLNVTGNADKFLRVTA